MTFQQILWAINDAAEAAAESAVEAHGEEIPSAEIAWEFINELYGMGERPIDTMRSRACARSCPRTLISPTSVSAGLG
jgi:hypothetical protein